MKNRWLILTVLAVAVVATGCGGGGGGDTTADAPAAAPAPAPSATPAAGTGTVTGTISYANGDTDTVISMDADPECVALHPDGAHTEQIVGDEGKLGNVFVYVKEGLSGSYTAPAEAAVLDQVGCLYTPRVSGVMTGQELIIRNSDQTLHNVHALPENNPEFNQGQPFAGMELKKQFDTAEIMVRFKCDVHPWMGAYMGVVDHPFFAVSAADGTYTIEGLPAGEYTLEAWHETLGTQTTTVTVSDDTASAASFEFAAAAG